MREARQIVSAHCVNVLLASFPPASAAQLGATVQKRTGLPLVLDFRDRWLGEGGYQPSSERQRRRHIVLERWCASQATTIIAVSDAMAQAIAAEQDLPAAHVVSVLNGYEPSVRPPRPAEHRVGKPVVVAHVGTVIPRNRPDRFLESLLRLDRESDLSGVVFRFVGNLSPGYVERLGLASVVQTTGLVSRDAARQEMQAADALLLLVGAYVGHWGHNAKVFEYIQTGRPILCLEEKPGSNDRRLIERFAADRAFFAALGDAEALSMELRRLREYLSRHSQPAIELDDAFREYSRPQQAARLAECLERARAGWR